MSALNAGLRLGAIVTAMGVTFAIVWALSSYGYPNVDARGAPTLAAKEARAKACL